MPSERAFSAAGLTLTKQRATLDSKTADAIIFLNKNLRGPLQKAAVAISDTTPFGAGVKLEPIHEREELKTVEAAQVQEK